ncbi:MAG: alpha/beta hydrolase [Bacteroidota bacterium]
MNLFFPIPLLTKQILQTSLGMLMLFPLLVQAQTEIPLYPEAIPNARQVPDTERVEDRGEKTGRVFWDTAIPTLTIYQPEKPNGQGVVICPGGGYALTAFDKEGLWVAEQLMEEGITAFVLKYRIPQDSTCIDKSLAPLQDAQQAIRYARQYAEKYQLNPRNIGIMGFSAGGHLAASAATHFYELADASLTDTTSVRPDFAALIYPVISFSEELAHKGSRRRLIGDSPTEAQILHWSNEKQVKADTPPTFLVHAADDRSVKVENSLVFYQACLAHSVSVEMHLYPEGGHGFGMYNTTTEDVWMERMKNWLKGLK